MFEKLLKPAYTVLRKTDSVSSAYIDDAYLQGNTYDDWVNNNTVDKVESFFTSGLILHADKLNK